VDLRGTQVQSAELEEALSNWAPYLRAARIVSEGERGTFRLNSTANIPRSARMLPRWLEGTRISVFADSEKKTPYFVWWPMPIMIAEHTYFYQLSANFNSILFIPLLNLLLKWAGLGNVDSFLVVLNIYF